MVALGLLTVVLFASGTLEAVPETAIGDRGSHEGQGRDKGLLSPRSSRTWHLSCHWSRGGGGATPGHHVVFFEEAPADPCWHDVTGTSDSDPATSREAPNELHHLSEPQPAHPPHRGSHTPAGSRGPGVPPWLLQTPSSSSWGRGSLSSWTRPGASLRKTQKSTELSVPGECPLPACPTLRRRVLGRKRGLGSRGPMAWPHSPVLWPRPCQPKGLLSARRSSSVQPRLLGAPRGVRQGPQVPSFLSPCLPPTERGACPGAQGSPCPQLPTSPKMPRPQASASRAQQRPHCSGRGAGRKTRL